MDVSRITPEDITTLNDGEIFVFGSNLAGIHGAGAAKIALQWGAIMGYGIGLKGYTYAIPTKNRKVETLPLNIIERYIEGFLLFTKLYPELNFLVTRIGCGLAGYADEDIAPMFKYALKVHNICLPESFWKIIES
jgi:hypothetical protein